ncbi:MAG: hypothetical protein R3293_01200 [Candidatus Promineifilaceae bacterium]|nr:hypothetical protein [Candidatus Promineifilaceae bacterium]
MTATEFRVCNAGSPGQMQHHIRVLEAITSRDYECHKGTLIAATILTAR